MASFKPTKIINYQKKEQKWTPDNIYWLRMKDVAVVQENGHVSSVDFHPDGRLFAATSSAKVEIFDAGSCEVVNTLSKFKAAAYSGVFRHDGALLSAGGAEGKLRVFDVQHATKAPLRTYAASTGAIRCTQFMHEGKEVVCMSDDGKVRGFDVSSTDAKAVFELDAHSDHVRTGCASIINRRTIVSGSYDHTVKLWDTRNTQEAVFTVPHGAPVECVLLFPNDSLLATAGGTTIKIWDVKRDGKQLSQISQHHRTITSLRLCSQYKRLISAALDAHVKVYDVNTYETVHTLGYAAPVLSVAISADDSVMAVGMAGSGLLAVQRRQPQYAANKNTQHSKLLATNTYRLNRGLAEKKKTVEGKAADESKMKRYDHFLRSFQYSRALTYVVQSKYFTERRPEVIVSLLKELSRRGALEKALAGRDFSTLAPLLKFISKNIGKPKFSRILTGTTNLLLELYKDCWEELEDATITHLKSLLNVVDAEISLQHELVSLQGMIEYVLANIPTSTTKKIELQPSVFGQAVVEKILLSDTIHFIRYEIGRAGVEQSLQDLE